MSDKINYENQSSLRRAGANSDRFDNALDAIIGDIRRAMDMLATEYQPKIERALHKVIRDNFSADAAIKDRIAKRVNEQLNSMGLSLEMPGSSLPCELTIEHLSGEASSFALRIMNSTENQNRVRLGEHNLPGLYVRASMLSHLSPTSHGTSSLAR